jgi:hypothetical protein
VTKALAHYHKELITIVKSFIGQTHKILEIWKKTDITLDLFYFFTKFWIDGNGRKSFINKKPSGHAYPEKLAHSLKLKKVLMETKHVTLLVQT